MCIRAGIKNGMVYAILFEGKAIDTGFEIINCGGLWNLEFGKLFHVVIVLGKKLYLNESMLAWHDWKHRVCARKLRNFGWRYG